MTALFVDAGEPQLVEQADRRVVATDWCRGPWDVTTLHGGPVCALLAFGVQARFATLDAADQAGWLCSRLTVDIMSLVPLGPIEVVTNVVKQGRRAVVIDAELWVDHRGTARMVARSSSQWIARRDDATGPEHAGSSPIPPRTGAYADPGSDERFEYPRPGFNVDTCDLEYVVGSHEDPGPGISWVRFKIPVIEGIGLTPLTRIAALADLAAATGWDNTPEGGNYINPDVTLQLAREPVGEWVAISAETLHGQGSAVLAARLYDDNGFVGLVTQSLVEAPNAL